MPRRGDSPGEAWELLTYYLFTKKLSLFHIGWYFEEVPTVNPSVTPPACQLPLAREPCGQRPQPILNPGAALYKVKKIRENLRFWGFSLIIYMVLVHSVMRMPGISQMQ